MLFRKTADWRHYGVLIWNRLKSKKISTTRGRTPGLRATGKVPKSTGTCFYMHRHLAFICSSKKGNLWRNWNSAIIFHQLCKNTSKCHKCKEIKSAKTTFLWDCIKCAMVTWLTYEWVSDNLHIMQNPPVYSMSWCDLPFPRSRVSKLRDSILYR